LGKSYQVVVSSGIEFFLKADEVINLATLNQPWALETSKQITEDFKIFTPSQEEVPRHAKALVELAKTIKRFDVIDLEVKKWPPKYAVINSSPTGGEKVIEPLTVPWKTAYHPEDYAVKREMTDEELIQAKIRSIAP